MVPPGLVTRTISAAVARSSCDVLDDLVGEDQVEVVVGIGQVLAHGQHDVGQLRAGLGDALLLDLDAVDVVGVLAEAAHVGADAAADVEHARVLEVDEPAHHLAGGGPGRSARSSWGGRARSTWPRSARAAVAGASLGRGSAAGSVCVVVGIAATVRHLRLRLPTGRRASRR